MRNLDGRYSTRWRDAISCVFDELLKNSMSACWICSSVTFLCPVIGAAEKASNNTLDHFSMSAKSTRRLIQRKERR